MKRILAVLISAVVVACANPQPVDADVFQDWVAAEPGAPSRLRGLKRC